MRLQLASGLLLCNLPGLLASPGYPTYPTYPTSQKPKFCSLIGGLVTQLQRTQAATAFCSSYLHIPEATATTTVIKSRSAATAQVTVTTTVSTQTSITTVVATTVTTTVDNPSTITEDGTCTLVTPGPSKREEQERRAVRPVATPACVRGKKPALISSACSCLQVPKHTRTVTKSVTASQSTATRTSTASITAQATTSTTITSTSTVSTVTVTRSTASSYQSTIVYHGNGFQVYGDTDFPGNDLSSCYCDPTSQDEVCYLDGGNGGSLRSSCNNQNDCFRACADTAYIFGIEHCRGATYDEPTRVCRFKGSVPQNGCGGTYSPGTHGGILVQQ